MYHVIMMRAMSWWEQFAFAFLNEDNYEKKFYKQWCSSIPQISIKRTITSHPNSLNTKNTTTYHIGNPDPGLGQAQKCGGVKLVNGMPFFVLHQHAELDLYSETMSGFSSRFFTWNINWQFKNSILHVLSLLVVSMNKYFLFPL